MKFCDEIVRKIEAVVSRGITNKTACEYVGINNDTLTEWQNNNPRDIWECDCIVKVKDTKGNVTETYKKPWEKEKELPQKKGGICPKCKVIPRLKPAFSVRIKKARSKGEIKLLNEIQTDPDWKAKAWTLERTRPEKYARPDRNRPREEDSDKKYLTLEEWRKANAAEKT